MNILVLSQAYPSEQNSYAMSYVHTRCIKYKQQNCDVSVLSFSAKESYFYEGVKVCTESEIDINQFDIIVSHAPNIKNHVRFLSRVNGRRIAIFFHGHEVLHTYRDYPEPYHWKKPSCFKRLIVNAYDYAKVKLMRYWLARMSRSNSLGLVFVSKWMLNNFEKNLKCNASLFGRYVVIANAVNDVFYFERYTPADIAADFITIRPLDDSKYSIDLVMALAKANPSLSFHVYGKGEFFNHNSLHSNVKWFDGFVRQCDIPELLNRYRAVLMPTRYDAQGVMTCEMATFGIPVITSDISICHEMLDGFKNVMFLSSEDFAKPMKSMPAQSDSYEDRFLSDRLISKELSFFNEL